MLGDSGRSWLSGYGTNYPPYIWHKPSYNSYIDWSTRGVTVFANWSIEQTDSTYKRLLYAPLAKFDMEGAPLQGHLFSNARNLWNPACILLARFDIKGT